MRNDLSIIKEMPKVELHLHLEGAFTFEFLLELMKKYQPDPEIKSPADLQKKFVFKNFDHFLELWFWKNKFFVETEDFEECTYRTLQNLSQQNVIYCEVYYSPWDFTANELSVEEITTATLQGIHRAKRDFNIHCHLIADIVRDYGAETAVERVKQVLPFINEGIIGIGLGGSESQYPARLFKPAFDEAAEQGFHRVVHAGEAAGPESVWEAIQDLHAERIGHGVRSIEDPQLISFLQAQQIPLEVCVISNLKTKVYSSPNAHPIRRLYDQGLFITINSDDPAMFNTSITSEFIFLYEHYGFSLSEIRDLSLRAVEATFLSEEEKENLRTSVLEYWQSSVI